MENMYSFPKLHYGSSTKKVRSDTIVCGLLNGCKTLNINSFFYRWFQHLISFLIIINTINLSLYDYSDRNSLTLRNKIIDKIDDFLTSMFILEAVAKILAMGFVIHKYSYLRYGWNIVDLIIVAAG